MCEATAFMIMSDSTEEKLMESVTRINVEDGKIIIDDLFGERKEISGVIKTIDLVRNRIDIIKQFEQK